MIIAVNKCPQNITLKAFNLSPQIYILSVSIFPKMDGYGDGFICADRIIVL